MKIYVVILLIIFCSFGVHSQNLNRFRIVCADEVDMPLYDGELSTEELKNQPFSLGFRYIENDEIKYHDELIIYNCNTGKVKLTAEFDKNRLVNDFVVYDASGEVEKELKLLKNFESPYVDLNFEFRLQKVAAYPTGIAKIYDNGKLIRTIDFNSNDQLPYVINYDFDGNKSSEGKAEIKGLLDSEWNIQRVGAWKNYKNGKLLTENTFSKSGQLISEKIYENGNLVSEMTILNSSTKSIKRYYTNGTIKESGKEKEGSKIELWNTYREDGSIVKKVNYADGLADIVQIFDENENLIQLKELITDKEDIPKSFQDKSEIYETKKYFSNGQLKSYGLTQSNNPLAIHEFYNEKGDLIEISEYDFNGNKINSVDAKTYLEISKKKKQIFNEILVLKTTHPQNLNQLESIKILSDSLYLDYDSVIAKYDYKAEFENKLSYFLDETKEFDDLSNDLEWYDTLYSSISKFNDRNWKYSFELIKKELQLQKEFAVYKMNRKFKWIKDNVTSSKKTLFGSKIIVKNNQDEVYESISEELFPTLNEQILNATDKYKVISTSQEFESLVEKAAYIIDNPDEKFRQSLKNSKTVNDKKRLFFSAK
ncbi:hypothetical protein QYS48_30315 [Marivirga arenosa]|uniref:Antitoxin component YwqK of the YwqJK toxin-antitoxin module n=1 Tax=Marivirga arenosa TaxID=3059076 RepID=A0AA51NB98_9BACT|nr:hypothetical protein [Marivirga sp. ABR2-2]WMN07906.1 hypothetical protein QYS48_30315 [Marivirga sp. ABR2-2]